MGEVAITAEKINETHRLAKQSAETAVEYAIRCGQLLTEKKKDIPHGEWSVWVETNCDFGERQSRRYQQAAKRTLASNFNSDEMLSLGREIWGHAKRDKPDTSLETPDLPPDKFNLIYADPPWRYEFAQSDSRQIENQYPTMDIDDICALPISTLAHDDCVLFLWATSPKLPEAMAVIQGWGFDYKTCAVWDKGRIGMGYYFRQQHELLLVATRGQPTAPDPETRVSSVFRERRDDKHSKKPNYVIDVIEQMYPSAKRIELFCRDAREGWTAWGNEVAA